MMELLALVALGISISLTNDIGVHLKMFSVIRRKGRRRYGKRKLFSLQNKVD
jgi:hypothetical protein